MDAIIEAAGKLVVLIGMGTVVAAMTVLGLVVYAWLRVMLIRAGYDVAKAEMEAKARPRRSYSTDLEKVVR